MIEWYPGHIARARREIKENLKLVDVVIEVIDARCPMSSINFLSEEIKGKKRLLIVNKIDLIDEESKTDVNSKLLNLIDKNDVNEFLFLDSRNNSIQNIVNKKIDKICESIVLKNINKGIQKTLIKSMVVGMPNVGKSTFINSYVKKKVNNVANRPGVTKSISWTKISDKMILLDTPGVTVPKFKNDNVGINLALIGSINDDIIEKQDLAYKFIEKVKNKYYNNFINRYKLKNINSNCSALEIMDEIAKLNFFINKNKEIDYEKVSNLVINDFRKGLLGKIYLEW